MIKISINDILELIVKLKEKMSKYGDNFSKNEFLVRYSLIDPFLRALGWDTEDPDQVKPEYSIGAGRPDYALFLKGKKSPIAFVGAKKLGKAEDLEQHVSYCVQEGVKFFITTDGDHWEFYDTFKQTRTPDKKVVEWYISREEPSRILFKSLSIANLETFGETPLTPYLTNVPEQSNNKSIEAVTSSSELYKIQSKRINVQKIESLKPLSLTINGETFPIKKSKEVLIQTTEWLIRKGKLTNSTPPIEVGPKRWLINSKPIHKDGKEFRGRQKLSNGLYLETNFSTRQVVQASKNLMKHFGYPENLISVSWNNDN